MIVKLLYHSLIPEEQLTVSFFLHKHGMTDVYEKATVGSTVRDRYGFAGSHGRK